MVSPLRLRLALMMFLEYAAWGVWMPILGATLNDRHQSPMVIGYVYGAFWLGNLFSPFIGGQLADRVMSSQLFLSISHMFAAVAAFWLAYQTNSHLLIGGMFVWSLFYTPSLGITNSITLEQIDKEHSLDSSPVAEQVREKVFSMIRMCGTMGWIFAALCFYLVTTFVLKTSDTAGPITEMVIAGVFSILMAVYSLTLPNTPPHKKSSDPLAFRKAFKLFNTVPGFTMFMLISFFAATEFMFFYNLSAQYLETLHISHALIPIDKCISQIMEVVALGVLLPAWLPKKGMKWCLLVGSFAWPLRYVIFVIGKPVWLVVLSLGLHGFGYAFVIVVQQLYMDRVAPKDIRASAQSLLNIVTLGLGNVVGSIFCGKVQTIFTHNGHTNWVPVFMLPAVTTLVCAIAYMLTFHNRDVDRAAQMQLEAAS